MKLPFALETGLALILPSGTHADRMLYILDDRDAGVTLPGLYQKVKRSTNGNYMQTIHEGGVLALFETNHKGAPTFKVGEFVPSQRANEQLCRIGVVAQVNYNDAEVSDAAAG